MKTIIRNISYVLLLFGLIPSSVLSRTFTVNAVEDVNDLTPGNGLCVSYLIIIPPFVLPFCTLRAAIEESNTFPGKDIVVLPSGLMSLSLAGEGENNSFTGDLDITESVTIEGKGPNETIIDGKSLDRIFDIIDTDIVVTIKDATLINGKIVGSDSDPLRGGAAIRNRGELRLDNVVLSNHMIEGNDENDLGGILLNFSECHISNSTLQGGEAYEGGAFYNIAGSKLTFDASTISNNDASIGAGGSNYGELFIRNSTLSKNGSSRTLFGGGLENGGFVSLQHVTLAHNRATSGAGISSKKTMNLQNSIVGENFGGDCFGAENINSLGNNLDSDDSCILTQDSDISKTDPELLPLKNNGGATKTHLLKPFSPARDTGFPLARVAVDQRGVKRPKGIEVDIGAVENEVFALPPLIFPLLRP